MSKEIKKLEGYAMMDPDTSCMLVYKDKLDMCEGYAQSKSRGMPDPLVHKVTVMIGEAVTKEDVLNTITKFLLEDGVKKEGK